MGQIEIKFDDCGRTLVLLIEATGLEGFACVHTVKYLE